MKSEFNKIKLKVKLKKFNYRYDDYGDSWYSFYNISRLVAILKSRSNAPRFYITSVSGNSERMKYTLDIETTESKQLVINYILNLSYINDDFQKGFEITKLK